MQGECHLRNRSHLLHDRGHPQLQQLPEAAAGAGRRATALRGLQLTPPRLQGGLPLRRMPAGRTQGSDPKPTEAAAGAGRRGAALCGPQLTPPRLQGSLPLCRMPAGST